MRQQLVAAVLRRCLLLLLISLGGTGFCQPLITQYQNPLDVSIADPDVLKDDGVYYLYGTTYDAGFGVFTSTDLVNWQRRGLAWSPSASSWGQADFWAPEVIRAGNTYYLFYTARNLASGRRNICVAASLSPLGPFTDVATPIMPAGAAYIDGHPYRDPVSGKYFLYAVTDDAVPPQIVVTELTNPPTARVGAISNVMTVSQPWEGQWVEAPYIFRHNAHYYVMYSARWFWESAYSVGYATAPDLRGPWTKAATNPIIKETAEVSGPGHNSVVRSPDDTELFAVYHTHLNFAGGGQRQLAIDRLTLMPVSGQPSHLALQQGKPTRDLQPLPSGAAPHLPGISDGFDSGVLDRSRWNVFGEDITHWKMQFGQLIIDTQNGDISNDALNARNIFLQYAPPGDFSIETRVTFAPTANFEQAFLILWDDQSNFIRFGCVFAGGSKIEVGRDIDGVYSAQLVNNTWGNYLRLRLQRTGNQVLMFVGSGGGASWTQIGPALPFAALQPQIGLGALSPLSGARKEARFDYFNLHEPSQVGDWQIY